MQYKIVGSDPETGESLEMVVSAATVQEATSTALRRNVHVMSVSPADVRRDPTPQRLARNRRGVGQATAQRPGRDLRKLVAILLVAALLVAPFCPGAPLTAGVALLLAVCAFTLASKSRSRLRPVLGVWPDRPVRGGFKLCFLGIYGCILLGGSVAGTAAQEQRRQEEEQRLAEEAANRERRRELAAEVKRLMDAAKKALASEDITTAADLARQASELDGAPNRHVGRALIEKIDGASDPEYVVRLLARAPEAEFQRYKTSGELPPSLDLGFPVLNERAQVVARATVQEAIELRDRERLEAERLAEERRKEDERVAERRRKEAAQRAQVEREKELRGKDIEAFVMSQEFVKRRLRAPSTADFPWYKNSFSTYLGDGRYRITAYVDAQNGFGAMLRSTYTCVLRTEGDSWVAESVAIN